MEPFLYRLARVNRTAVFLSVVAAFLLAALAPGPLGAVLLLVIAVPLGGLTMLTWRAQPAATRAARLAILSGLVVFALVKLTG